MSSEALLELLNIKADQYNHPSFIEDDPISIPHMFSKPLDIEISAFLTAIISWGQRKTIIRNAKTLMELMEWSPADFILNHTKNERAIFDRFVHRTFNSTDCKFFIQSLQHLIQKQGSLEHYFISKEQQSENLYRGIILFRDAFFAIPHPTHTLKHISNIEKGSTGKRINMFLRWMVRHDKKGVDFGIWKMIKPSQLYLPLDVHTVNASRKLELLTRKTQDWKAVLEITHHLREMDPMDPIKYDFALFGLSRFDDI